MTIKKMTSAIAVFLFAGMLAGTAFGAGETVNVPRLQVPPPATVAVVRDNSVNYASMVSDALEAALGPGGISNLVHSGQTVLIKPNLVVNNAAAVTDWRVVKALVDQIRTVNGGADIIIADGAGKNYNGSDTRMIMNSQGYTAANFPGVLFADLNDLSECPTDNFVLQDGASDVTTKQVAALIYEADVYINVPKMKTDEHAGFSGAVKNIGMGVPSWELWRASNTDNNKSGLYSDFRREILDHILCRVPDLTVMDAVRAMEGQGPLYGNTVNMNLVLAGKDPVAVDAVACNIMNIPPYLITYLELAANENVGIIDINNITVTGNVGINEVKRNFARAFAEGVIPPRELAVIPYRATTIIRRAPHEGVTIDGTLDEWGYANAIDINTLDQVKSNNSWNGPEDCSLTGLFMYDADNLYVAMYVKDNTKLPNNATGAAIRNGECIELYLSTYSPQYDNNHGTTYRNEYDHKLAISYADNPHAYMFSHNRPVDGFSASKVETSDGYLIEAKIPWNNFNNFSYSNYRQIGINVALSDADENASTVSRKIYWNSATKSDVETNPQQLGMSYLDPDGGIYSVPTCALNITAVNGTVTKDPDSDVYNAFSVVDLTATPNAGFYFDSWSDGVRDNPHTLFLRYPTDIAAIFSDEPIVNAVYQINTGNNTGYTPFLGDRFVSGGNQRTVGNTIDLSGVTNPAPMAVYQSERYGNSNYTFSGLTAGAEYGVRLHFAELYQTSAGVRRFNVAINGTEVLSNFDIFAETGARYKATVREFTAAANSSGEIQIVFTAVANYPTISGIEIIETTPDLPPTVATPAAADPSPVTGNTTILSVLGDDDGGEEMLIYSWATTGTPPEAVTFTNNNSNAAKNTEVTFTKAGDYTFRVTISDASHQTVTGTVTVTVDQTLTSAVVNPSPVTLEFSETQQFSATGRDQFEDVMSSQPTFTWSVEGVGSIDEGLYTAGTTAGNATVTATSGTVSGSATVTVIASDEPPTVATPAAADPSPVTGNTTDLSVLGDDDGSEENLIYIWSATPSVTFSANGTNDAKNTSVTFTGAGEYTFTVAVRDAADQTVTSTVNVTVDQTITSVMVDPSNVTLNVGETEQFVAVARDQFGTAMSSQPIFTWGVEGVGTISPDEGRYSAGAAAGTATVTATNGAVAGAANVTVILEPDTVFQINTGNNTGYAPFLGDRFVSGGIQRTVGNTIDLSGVTNPAPMAVYQSERYGNSNYTFSGLTAGAEYGVRLHFAELYQTSAGRRRFNVAINGTQVLSNFDIFAETGARYKATVREFTSAANSSGEIQIVFTTVADNATISGIEIIETTPDLPPTVATSAAAAPSPVTGNTTILSVLGDDDGGEEMLIYSWEATGTPPAAVTFTNNNSNAAKNTEATFTKAGQYTFTVTIRDAAGQTVTSTVTVMVDQTLTSAVVTPSPVTLEFSEAQEFSAIGSDQFGDVMSSQPTFTWTVEGVGSIDEGLYTAGTTAGSATVTAASGTVSGSATVTVIAPDEPPTIEDPSVNPSPVTGTTAELSVVADDDNGEENLIYTWSATPSVTFSANGTNDAKNTTATFTSAGEYTITVTVRDAADQTVSSSVFVTVIQTLTSAVVDPSNVTLNVGGTEQFVAVARDQFGTAMSSQPIFTWGVEGVGTISPDEGRYSAGAAAGTATVTATNGAVAGAANVTVILEPDTVFQINTGNNTGYAPFLGDRFVSGGIQRTVGNTINLSDVTNPAPMAVYQSERYGNSNYTFSGLTAGAEYGVRLHFAELYQTSAGRRRFNVAINGTQVLSNFDIFAETGARFKATVREFTAAANSSGEIQIVFTTVADNATISGIEIIETTPDLPPTVATPAAAAPSPVTGNTTILSVLGDDDGGEEMLIYSWEATGTPPAAVTFTNNNSNAAKNTEATFTKAGQYTFRVTISDASDLTVTSTVTVTVDQTLTSAVVTPSPVMLEVSETQEFSAIGSDQFGDVMSSQPTFTWTVEGVGSIDEGLYTAGTTAGSATVTAASGTVSGSATVTVIAPDDDPTIATPAAADPSPVTGNTTDLSVLGADDNGEENLIYTWATTGTPPAAVEFSANNSNGAKNTTATFTRAGEYTFEVTIEDAADQTVTSTVIVTVDQTITSVVVDPSDAAINVGDSVQFSAAARDQFEDLMSTQPIFTWDVDGVGSITPEGLYIAGAAGGSATVTATNGAVAGIAEVTVDDAPAGLYIYDDSLAGGYSNYSWSTVTDFSDDDPVHDGAYSLAIDYSSGWAGLLLQKNSGTQSHTGFSAYSFWGFGGTNGISKCEFFIRNGSETESTHFRFDLPANTWTKITIPLSELGNPADAKTIIIQDASGTNQSEFNIDNLMLQD